MEHDLSGGQPLDFDEFANQLLEQGAEQSPAHLHGAICGVLSRAGAQDPDYCLGMSSQALGLDIHGELADSCLRLADITLRALQDEEFDFHLFLPDDETDVESRVRALAEWCSAFLAGYAQAITEPQPGALPEDTAEVLKDIAVIAEATVDAESDEEESENHLFEVTEYLRFAILNLFMDALAKQQMADGEG